MRGGEVTEVILKKLFSFWNNFVVPLSKQPGYMQGCLLSNGTISCWHHRIDDSIHVRNHFVSLHKSPTGATLLKSKELEFLFIFSLLVLSLSSEFFLHWLLWDFWRMPVGLECLINHRNLNIYILLLIYVTCFPSHQYSVSQCSQFSVLCSTVTWQVTYPMGTISLRLFKLICIPG